MRVNVSENLQFTSCLYAFTFIPRTLSQIITYFILLNVHLNDCICFFTSLLNLYIIVLSKLVTSLKEADSLTSEKELSFLQNLLESKEINALVNVHSKVGKICKDEKFAPLMSSSIQVNKLRCIASKYVQNNGQPWVR